MLKTSNSGINWTLVNLGTNVSLTSLFFVNSLTGWVGLLNGNLMKTTNGGINYSSQLTGNSYGVSSIDFINENTGWVTSKNYVAYDLNRISFSSFSLIPWACFIITIGCLLSARYFNPRSIAICGLILLAFAIFSGRFKISL